MRTSPNPVRSRRGAHRAVLPVLLVLLGAGVLSVGPAGAAEKQGPAMSIARSARVYVGAVCPFNAVRAERAAVIDRLAAAGTPAAVGTPMPAELKATADRYVRAARRAFRTFQNPPAPWPDALQPNIAIATAYSATILQWAEAYDADTVPAVPPNVDSMIAAQKVNLPILRTALGIADGTDPCAGRRASDEIVTIQTVPQGAL